MGSSREVHLHLNHLELLAITKAFQAFESLLVSQVVRIATDNTMAVSYINKQGGTHSLQLLYLAVDLWEWCFVRHIYLVAVHVAAKGNAWADHLSRQQSCSHKWTLDSTIFQQLCHRWGTPKLDVFASQDKGKCRSYCSRINKSK